jgi:glycine reductase
VIETQLQAWRAELDRLKARVDRQIAEAKKEYYEHIEAPERQRQVQVNGRGASASPMHSCREGAPRPEDEPVPKPIRVAHYLNQFFSGIGGEAAASSPVTIRQEAAGAARALQAALGDGAKVVATIACGDNFFHDERERARSSVSEALRALRPDVLVAGPAFEAGRYGIACGEVCRLAAAEGIPAVAAMHPENPGVLMHRREVIIVPTEASAAGMAAALPAVARLALKLARGEALGTAESEGYLPRGVRKPGFRDEPGYRRAVDMLLAKLEGRPYVSEIPYQAPEMVEAAPPIADLRQVAVALVTTGGLVPIGNPDGQTSGNAQKYYRYPIDQLQSLQRGEWEAYHVGYFTHLVNQNPNYVLPLGYMRELERAGAIGAVHPYAYTLPGVSTPVAQSEALGRGIAAQLREAKVGACLLVST